MSDVRRHWCVLAMFAALGCTGAGCGVQPQAFQPAAQAERSSDARALALLRYSEWFGPPRGELRAGDQSGAGCGTLAAAGSHGLMDVERAAAFQVALAWWPHLDNTERPLRDAVAWYLHGPVVEELFGLAFHAEGYALDGVRLFGGAVPVAFTGLVRQRVSAGYGRDFLEGAQSLWCPLGDPGDLARARLTARGVLALATLERYAGWPALQGALDVLADGRGGGLDIDVAEAGRVIGLALGQDLSWFLEQAFDPDQRFDYAVQSLEARCAPDAELRTGCVTTVTVARLGSGVFSGRTTDGTGQIERSHGGLALEVTFEDGQQVRTHWDAEAATETFTFDSPTPGVTAVLDPDAVLLLDENPLNNRRSLVRRTNVPVAKWTSTWVTWLQAASLVLP